MSTVTSVAAIRPPPLTFGQLTLYLTETLPDFFIFLLVLAAVLLYIGLVHAIAVVSSLLAMAVGGAIAVYVLGSSLHFLWSTRDQQRAHL